MHVTDTAVIVTGGASGLGAATAAAPDETKTWAEREPALPKASARSAAILPGWAASGLRPPAGSDALPPPACCPPWAAEPATSVAEDL